MNTSTRKPLSTYLQELVHQQAVPESVAQILNHLPDWAQQREAAQEWKEGLDHPAKIIVAEFEGRNKGIDFPSGVVLDQTEILFDWPFFYLCEDLTTYISRLQAVLEKFLEETPCQVCGKSLGGGPRHEYCGFRPDGTPWDRSKESTHPRIQKMSGPQAGFGTNGNGHPPLP